MSLILKCDAKERRSQKSGKRMSSFRGRGGGCPFCGGCSLSFVCISNSFTTSSILFKVGFIIPILWVDKERSKEVKQGVPMAQRK